MVKDNLINKKRQEGFTIIEVLIVLAIAGLIMLIVFLAVPALQRNSRNTARTADAALVTSAISDCMANRNGTVASCNTTALLTSNGGLDTSRLKQLTTVTYTATAPTTTDSVIFQFAQKCTADGSAMTAGTARQSAILYNAEGGGGNIPKCIDV